MIRVLDDDGRSLDEYLIVRYGASAGDWEAAANERTFVELIDGRLIVHSPVSLPHARLCGFLERLLGNYVEGRDLGEVLSGPFTMDLTTDRKFEPDLMFLTDQTRLRLQEDRLVGPADFAIEIASRSTRAYDRGEKRECYRVGGVREYWMIDPFDQTVTVDSPAGHTVATIGTGEVRSSACDGFWILAEWLWSKDLPRVSDCPKRIETQ